MFDYKNMKPEDFNLNNKESRALMYCYRLSLYGDLDEKATYENWKKFEHVFDKSEDFFHELYECMRRAIDKLKECGYDAYRELELS